MAAAGRQRSGGAATWWLGPLMLFGTAAGCSSEADSTGAACPAGQLPAPDGSCVVEQPADCEPGELPRSDGSCQPAGLPPDMPCPPGQLQVDEDCVPAGIPTDGCAQGFFHDGPDGCEPLLPAEPCPPGQMAVPGDAQCRQVAACGSGTYGDIPIDGTAVFVDQSYGGADSDGTQARPWTALQDAVQAAPDGALIAVAEGSYVGGIRIQNKRLRLWGRCPSMVAIASTADDLAAVQLLAGASGSELRNLGMTGPGFGVLLSGASDVLLEALWIHDVGTRLLDIEDTLGPASATVVGSLLESTAATGVFVGGAELTLAGTHLRNIATAADGTSGHALALHPGQQTRARARVHVRGSLVERAHEVGIGVHGSDLSFEASVLRDTSLNGAGQFGWGLFARDDVDSGRPTVTVRQSVLESHRENALALFGTDAVLESSVIRDTAPSSAQEAVGVRLRTNPDTLQHTAFVLRHALVSKNGDLGVQISGATGAIEGSIVRGASLDIGWGVLVIANPEGHPARARVSGSVIEDNMDSGMFVLGAEVELDATIIRGAIGPQGRGLDVEHAPSKPRGTVTVRRCLFEDNGEQHVIVMGADFTMEESELRGPHGPETRGVAIQPMFGADERATATLRSVWIQDSRQSGLLALASEVSVDGCRIEGTTPDGDGLYGDGVMVQGTTVDLVVARLRRSAVVDSTRAAVSSFGGAVVLTSNRLRCQSFDLDGETYQGQPYDFDDRGDNLCGCPVADGACTLVTTGVTPPEPVAPDLPSE